MNRHNELAKYTTSGATCSGACRSNPSTFGIIARTAGDSFTILVRAQGATAFTRTPSRASSCAWLTVSAAIADLVAPYTPAPAVGCKPAADVVLTIAR
ncbi:MAG: hypothetical protein WCH38_01380 [Actinomycetota bacterium]